MHDKPPSAAELRLVKSFSAGRFVLGLETSSAIAGSLVDLDVYGLPPDSLDTYRTRVQAVTQDDVASRCESAAASRSRRDRRGRTGGVAARAARALRSGRSGGALVHDGRLAGRAARFAVIAVLALVTACASAPKTKSKSKPRRTPAPSAELAPQGVLLGGAGGERRAPLPARLGAHRRRPPAGARHAHRAGLDTSAGSGGGARHLDAVAHRRGRRDQPLRPAAAGHDAAQRRCAGHLQARSRST